MKEEKGQWTAVLEKCLQVVERYKFVFLVMLVGLVLLTLPDWSTETIAQEEGSATGTEVLFDLEETEQKLAYTLSQIEGVGEVSVMLTVKSGTQQILAQDTTYAQGEQSREESQSTLVISTGSGIEETVAIQQIYPQFQGALVVCEGANQSSIRLALIEAVSALTGLGSDKISICKGK